MSKENKELSDEELGCVSGGGDITIKGITYGSLIDNGNTYLCPKCNSRDFAVYYAGLTWGHTANCPNIDKKYQNFYDPSHPCYNCKNLASYYCGAVY